MLPGFRFLFAAIVLCFSILVFGLGAAALLRAAHEEFASKPSWRGTPETMFGQQNEASRPVLALLQVVEPEAKGATTDVTKEPVSEPVAPQRQDDALSAAAAPEPAATPSPAPEPQKSAALSAPDAQKRAAPEPTPPEAAAKTEPPVPEPAKIEDGKSQSSLGEGPATIERSSSPAQVPASERDIKTATSEDATPKAAEPSPAPSEPMNTPAPEPQPRPQPDPLAAMIATLGGPPEASHVQAPRKASNGSTETASDTDSIRKRLRARRAKEHRRLAQRPRVTQHAAVQQQPQQQQFPPPFLMEPSGAAAQAR